MKRILGLLTLLVIINACDDGKLTVDAIDFSEIEAQKCTNKEIIYKIKDGEMLLLAIPESTFKNDETPENEPIELEINGTNQVIYRKYSGPVTADNICPTIPNATPDVMEEWTATAGTIQITTTAIKTTNTADNSTRITGYLHHIVFKTITFLKPGNVTQTYVDGEFAFGNYKTSVTPLSFTFDQELEKSTCTSDSRIFDFNGSVVFILDVNDFDTLFANEVTTTPRTALIDANHKVSYRLYSNAITNSYFCSATPPATPTLSQRWDAMAGVEGVSGIIEVSTTTSGPGFQHTVVLKKVSLKSENSDFSLGDNYVLGTFITNP